MEFPSLIYKKDSDASTGLIFIRAYNKWHTAIKHELRDVGITHPQFVVMAVIGFLEQSGDFVTQASVARMADMDAMSVSQIIRGLEEKGYLERTANPKDTRANAVRLLGKGEEAICRALPAVERIDEEFFGILSDDETQFRDLLHKLIGEGPAEE